MAKKKLVRTEEYVKYQKNSVRHARELASPLEKQPPEEPKERPPEEPEVQPPEEPERHDTVTLTAQQEIIDLLDSSSEEEEDNVDETVPRKKRSKVNDSAISEDSQAKQVGKSVPGNPAPGLFVDLTLDDDIPKAAAETKNTQQIITTTIIRISSVAVTEFSGDSKQTKVRDTVSATVSAIKPKTNEGSVATTNHPQHVHTTQSLPNVVTQEKHQANSTDSSTSSSSDLTKHSIRHKSDTKAAPSVNPCNSPRTLSTSRINGATLPPSIKESSPAPLLLEPPLMSGASIKLLSDRAKECWVCQIELKQPLYTKHQHPIFDRSSDGEDENSISQDNLALYVCSVCAEEIAADDENTQDQCALCRKTDNDDEMCLFFCDDCPLSFCFECVASCHGGGEEGCKVARHLQNSPTDSWSCPVCHHPAALIVVRENTEPRTAEAAADDLVLLESEWENTQSILESKEEVRRDVIAELQKEKGDEVNSEDVDEEMDEWEDEWTRHEKRLRDTISQLHDELEHTHKVPLDALYFEYFGEERVAASSGDDLAWVLEADKVNRERQEKHERESELLPPESKEWKSMTDLELYQRGVEDLATDQTAEDLHKPKARGFSKIWQDPSPAEWKEALEGDEKAFSDVIQSTGHDCRPKVFLEQEDERLQNETETRVLRTVRQRSRFTAIRRKAKTPTTVIEAPTIPPTDPKPSDPLATFDANTKRNSDTKMADSSPTEMNRNQCNTGAKIPCAKIPDSCPNDVGTKSAFTGEKNDAQNHRVLPTKVVKKRAFLHQLIPQNLDSGKSSDASRNFESAVVRRIPIADVPEIFNGSSLVLQGSAVVVARDLVGVLKPHQKQAVQFLWRNCFADYIDQRTPDSKPGGCILAHNMGLGKSLSAIALIQAVLLHGLVSKVLLIVPVNTLENWKNEIKKWIGQMRPAIEVHDISDGKQNLSFQRVLIRGWHDRGGILMSSSQRISNLMLPNAANRNDDQTNPDYSSSYLRKADLVVIDEAHQCLKNQKTKISEAMDKLETPRRICLTGTPLQNNLFEYYNMVEFIRPGLLGPEKAFEREFITPIAQGLVKDCSPAQQVESATQTQILQQKLDPYVQRKDAKGLASMLPPMQQVVLHVRQTRLQSNLYRRYKRYQKETSLKNLFAEFSALKPINNHPGCLLIRGSQQHKPDEMLAEENDEPTMKWWESITASHRDDMIEVEQGLKIALLLHILVLAGRRNEKVVVFAQCLRTLDFVENVLERADWRAETPSLSELLDGSPTFGGWKKGRDYLRIDGGTSSSDRGGSITEFETNENIKAFLLTSVAGGVGINLVAANRVVLLDIHFNPAVSDQAIFRTYRYGQTKPVFVYRLLTQGSMEEKIYARTVTKTGLSNLVIDKKNVGKHFTEKEQADLSTNYNWVQCDRCEKWRVLLSGDSQSDLPEKWYCEMNEDTKNQSCDAPERSQEWYNAELDNLVQRPAEEPDESSLSKLRKLEGNDDILQHLLKVKLSGKSTKMVSKRVSHDLLVKPTEDASSNAKKKSVPSKAKGVASPSEKVQAANTQTAPKTAEKDCQETTDEAAVAKSPSSPEIIVLPSSNQRASIQHLPSAIKQTTLPTRTLPFDGKPPFSPSGRLSTESKTSSLTMRKVSCVSTPLWSTSRNLQADRKSSSAACKLPTDSKPMSPAAHNVPTSTKRSSPANRKLLSGSKPVPPTAQNMTRPSALDTRKGPSDSKPSSPARKLRSGSEPLSPPLYKLSSLSFSSSQASQLPNGSKSQSPLSRPKLSSPAGSKLPSGSKKPSPPSLKLSNWPHPLSPSKRKMSSNSMPSPSYGRISTQQEMNGTQNMKHATGSSPSGQNKHDANKSRNQSPSKKVPADKPVRSMSATRASNNSNIRHNSKSSERRNTMGSTPVSSDASSCRRSARLRAPTNRYIPSDSKMDPIPSKRKTVDSNQATDNLVTKKAKRDLDVDRTRSEKKFVQ